MNGPQHKMLCPRNHPALCMHMLGGLNIECLFSLTVILDPSTASIPVIDLVATE